MHRHLRRTVAVVGIVTVATLGFGSLGAGALTSTVDIRVEHNLDPLDGDQPRVLERLGVTPGPGFEVTIADEISNPDNWNGNVMVDIDPDAQQMIVEVEDEDCYNTVLVEITTDEIGAVSVISDELFAEPSTLSTSVSGGVVTLSWTADFCADLGVLGSQAVFSYTLADTTPPSTEDTTPPSTEDTTPPSTEDTSTTTAAAAQPAVATPRFTG